MGYKKLTSAHCVNFEPGMLERRVGFID